MNTQIQYLKAGESTKTTPLHVGERVTCRDNSGCLEVDADGMRHGYPSKCNIPSMHLKGHVGTVIAVNCKLPSDFIHEDVGDHNDTIISMGGKVFFTRARYLIRHIG